MMIRIETTAAVDDQGHFTVSGNSPSVVSPGMHRATVIFDDVPDPAAMIQREERSCLVERKGAFLLDAEPLPGAEMDINGLIEADRHDRMEHILGQPLR